MKRVQRTKDKERRFGLQGKNFRYGLVVHKETDGWLPMMIFNFHIKTDKHSCEWPVSVRYASGGLWEYTFEKLKERVIRILEAECKPIKDRDGGIESWCTLSRADYAFDLYSPKFTHEMNCKTPKNKLLLTSGVKAGGIWTGNRDETITIGVSKCSSLQIQVYDKGREIREKSNKTWMYKVWERAGYYPPEEEKGLHVWRVEIRFKKAFLKDRGIRRFEELKEHIKPLLAEALMRRRMIVDDNFAEHRERSALHPLWAAVYEEAGSAGEYVPLGRQITMARAEYVDMLQKQHAGLGRALSVAQTGHYNVEQVISDHNKAMIIAYKDPEHVNKVAKCVEKQRFINEAH